jgi:hypothetical protein
MLHRPAPYRSYFEPFRDGFSVDEIRSDSPCEGVAPPSRTGEACENRELVHRSVIPFKVKTIKVPGKVICSIFLLTRNKNHV